MKSVKKNEKPKKRTKALLIVLFASALIFAFSCQALKLNSTNSLDASAATIVKTLESSSKVTLTKDDSKWNVTADNQLVAVIKEKETSALDKTYTLQSISGKPIQTGIRRENKHYDSLIYNGKTPVTQIKPKMTAILKEYEIFTFKTGYKAKAKERISRSMKFDILNQSNDAVLTVQKSFFYFGDRFIIKKNKKFEGVSVLDALWFTLLTSEPHEE